MGVLLRHFLPLFLQLLSSRFKDFNQDSQLHGKLSQSTPGKRGCEYLDVDGAEGFDPLGFMGDMALQFLSLLSAECQCIEHPVGL